MTANPSLPPDGRDPSLPGKCTARNGRGAPCRAWAVQGATVCVAHGGAAPQVKAAAARRLARARLNGDLDQLLGELEVEAAGRHPVDVLLDAVHRANAMAQVLGALVGGLRTDGLPAVAAEGDHGRLWGRNHLGDGAQHVLVEMYGQWLDRAARAAKLALDAGVEERRVRLAEDQAQLIARMMLSFAEALGLDPTEERVRSAMRRSLTAVAGEGAA